MELKMTPWTEDTPPTEEELHEFLTGQELHVFRWVSPPQGVFDGHTHGYHKILYVVTGSIKFEFPTKHKTITLRPGDRLDLPAGLRHSAVAGGETTICLESHIY
jgi:quercetin dioxygenase-like cupin family protein